MAQETNAWIHSQIIEGPELTTRNIVSKKKNRIRKRVKEVNIVQRIAKYSKETFFKSICRY